MSTPRTAHPPANEVTLDTIEQLIAADRMTYAGSQLRYGRVNRKQYPSGFVSDYADTECVGYTVSVYTTRHLCTVHLFLYTDTAPV